MKSERDVVSIIITTYYRNDHLREAIESALAQSYSAVEVIVVDDSGEEHARPVATEYDIEYIPHDVNRGTNRARSTGIQHSNGRYVQLLDDDDRLHEEKLQSQIEVFETSDSIGVVYSGVVLCENGRRREILPDSNVQGDVLSSALTLNIFPCYTSSMLIDQGQLDQVMPLAVRPSVDDLWLMIELAKISKFDYVNQALVTKRQSDSSRGQGMKNVHGRMNLIEEYDELYEQFPSSLRGTALGNAYHQMGSLLIDRHIWSIKAIIAYWKALYYLPDPSTQFVGACIASLMGRPGISTAKFIRSWI